MEYIKKHPIRVTNCIIGGLGLASSYLTGRWNINIEMEIAFLTGAINTALGLFGVSKGK